MTIVNDDQEKLLQVFLNHLGKMSTGTRELVIMNLQLGQYAAGERIFCNGLELPVTSASLSSKPREWVQLEFDFGKD